MTATSAVTAAIPYETMSTTISTMPGWLGGGSLLLPLGRRNDGTKLLLKRARSDSAPMGARR